MMMMAISYELTGRTNQKARTREALVAAARELIAGGATPTVEDAAESAAISRATAYRYFRNQRALLAAAHPEFEVASLLGPDAPAGAEARLDAVVRELCQFVLDYEPALRTALRLSLEPEPAAAGSEQPVLRRGRAIAWIGDALSPLHGRMSDAELRRLVLAIRAAVGIEPFVWLTDIGGLTREQAAESMRWSALTLLGSARAVD
jgi:AcrR family transcriptional regulator